eukprot:TRINITY_DN980_c0_g1_i1.p1 TRINITY_DN980_c0_g1~~TRINITY_DN980_c0_g1_i1.p1  ORF type:complete len:245 (-),score=77.60 TRINITY_DN980_c0_g1_i1:52-729(-)
MKLTQLFLLFIVATTLLQISVDAQKRKKKEHDHSSKLMMEDYPFVTCGSVIKLKHTSTDFRLHSHEIPYGTGSKQQSVTGFPGAEDGNSYWMVKPAFKKECKQGEVIKNGDMIRLQHVNTKRFLHSHLHASPLSNQQEVSCYGDGSHESGDTGDNWRVEIDGNGQWKRSQPIRLQHIDTHKYLHSHAAHRYRNPIPGQQEVTCFAYKNNDNLWSAEEGIYYPPQK